MTAPISDKRIAVLRRIAEAATPGPWAVTRDSEPDDDGFIAVNVESPSLSELDPILDWSGDEKVLARPQDADYIAYAEPSTLLALLDRLESAEAALRP